MKGKTPSFFYNHDSHEPRIGRLIAAVLIVLLVLITFLKSFVIIPSGYTGVKSTFGQVSDEFIPNSLVWKIPYVQKIEKVCNKQQTTTVKGRFWGETTTPEQTPVYAEGTTVTYRINADKSAWAYLNVVNYKKNILPENDIVTAVKIAMRELTSEKVTNRGCIGEASVKHLQKIMDEKYGEQEVVKIISVTIADMDFEESYNAAIANKSQAQKDYETQQITNKRNLELKQAEAEQRKVEAGGLAEAAKIAAQAEAEAVKIKADAQAEANNKLAASLSENLIYYTYAQAFKEKWNGSAPNVIGTDNSIFSYGLNKE